MGTLTAVGGTLSVVGGTLAQLATGITTSPMLGTAYSSQLATTANSNVNNANKYTLVTWLPTAYPGTGTMAPATNSEGDVRPVTDAALGLACALAAGVHDETATGVTLADATAACVRMVSGWAASHLANGGMWGGAENTPPPDASAASDPNWQCAMWAGSIALAGWLIQDDLTDTDRDNLAAMTAWEADRMLGWTLPYWRDETGTEIYPGDGKAEELCWDASVVSLARLLMPNHPHAGQWLAKLVEMAVAAHSTPADATDNTVVNGTALSALVNGSNVQADGTVVNHGIIHPDYMIATNILRVQLVAYAAAGVAPPAALAHHAELIYGALQTVDFTTAAGYQAPGGTIYVPDSDAMYYPQGSDHGTTSIAHAALMDVLAHTFGWDTGLSTPAHDWALLHLQAQADLQARSSSGQTYLNSTEFPYAGAEQWAAYHCGLTVLTLHVGRPSTSNADPAGLRTELASPTPITVVPEAAMPPLAGLLAWFKADSITGLADGGALPASGTAWADSTGNGHDLISTGASPPTFKVNAINGLPAVKFNGTNQRLDNAAFANAGDTSILVVGRVAATAAVGLAIAASTVNTAAQRREIYWTPTTFNFHEVSTTNPNVAADLAYHVFATRMAASATGTPTPGPVTRVGVKEVATTNATFGGGAQTGIRFGCFADGTYSPAEVQEYLVYNRMMGADAWTAVLKYLSDRSGLPV